MDELRAILYGVLPGIAGGLLLVGLLGRRWLGLAISLGVVVAFCLLRQTLPEWPHDLYSGRNDAMEWLIWCLLLAGAMSIVGGRKLLPLRIALPPVAVLLCLQVWLMLRRASRRWESGEVLLHHGLAMVAFVGLWLLLRRTAVQRRGLALGIAWTACLSIDAFVLLEGRSALQGQLAGGAAAALGAAVGTALWRRPFSIDASAPLPLLVAHGGLLLAGYHISYPRPRRQVADVAACCRFV